MGVISGLLLLAAGWLPVLYFILSVPLIAYIVNCGRAQQQCSCSPRAQRSSVLLGLV